MNRVTMLRNTERARADRVTAAGMLHSPGRRLAVHHGTPLPTTLAGAPDA
jgi:hypothetical protein